MSSSPFSPSNDVCIIDHKKHEYWKSVNGKLMTYEWCFQRNYPAPAVRQSCSTKLTRRGSIMSVGGTSSHSTGSYSIQSRNYVTKYSSSTTAPDCVNVASGDLLSWEAMTYSNSNELCFSDSSCPASTTTFLPSSSSEGFDTWIIWSPIVFSLFFVCCIYSMVRQRRLRQQRMQQMLARNATPQVTTTQVMTAAPTPVVATAYPGGYGATEVPVATAIPQAEAEPMAQAVAQPLAQAVAQPVSSTENVPVAVATVVPQL